MMLSVINGLFILSIDDLQLCNIFLVMHIENIWCMVLGYFTTFYAPTPLNVRQEGCLGNLREFVCTSMCFFELNFPTEYRMNVDVGTCWTIRRECWSDNIIRLFGMFCVSFFSLLTAWCFVNTMCNVVDGKFFWNSWSL